MEAFMQQYQEDLKIGGRELYTVASSKACAPLIHEWALILMWQCTIYGQRGTCSIDVHVAGGVRIMN